MIRLAQLDPLAVAAEVAQAVHHHMVRRGLDLDIDVPPLSDAAAKRGAGTSLGYSTALLTDWAKRGTNGEEWDEGMAWDAVQHVCTALYSRAGEPGTFGGGPIDEGPQRADPDTAIEVVLLAAWCRTLLTQRTDVPVRALAALSGLRQQSIRNLATDGELAMHQGLVAPDEARRWLSGRGVPLP